MNRKIMMSGLSIVTALAMMGGSAFAAFTTTATATGNTFSTSNPSLQISTDSGANYGDSRPGFNVSGLVPGATTAQQNFVLRNVGTDVLPVSAQFNYDTNLNTLTGDKVDFTITCTGSQPVTHTYSEWINSAYTVGTVNAGADLNCSMTATLHANVGNDDKNKKAVFDAVFTGTVGEVQQ